MGRLRRSGGTEWGARPAARLAVLAALVLLGLPAGAGAAGFGPTTSPLSEQPPSPTTPGFAFASFQKLTIFSVTGNVEVPTVGTVDTTRNVSIAGNARGDLLVAWTENSGTTHKAMALFWPAGAAPASLVAHELLTGGTVDASAPFAVLDPGGSATIVWAQASALHQVTTADAGAANPWGAPTQELGAGGGMGASLPDGRAVYAFLHGYSNGSQVWYEALFSTRTAGQPFRPPASLVGGGNGVTLPARIAATAGPPAIRAAISPAGRALVSYIATDGVTPDPPPCDPYNREVHAVLATVTPGSGPPSFTDQAVSEPGDPDPQELLGIRAGGDDRLAMAWKEVTGGCWNTVNRPERRMAAYVAPGQTSMTPTGVGIPGPPAAFRDLWWGADGRLLFWTQVTSPSTVNSQTPYDTGVPLQPITPPAGGGGGGPTPPPPPTPPSEAPAATPTPGAAATTPPSGAPPSTSTTVARVVPTTFSATQRGTVTMTIAAPGSGDFAIQLLARRSGLIAAAPSVLVRSYRVKAKRAGPLKVTLALTGRALKTLRKKGRLAVTVRTTFTPSGGGGTVTSTKAVTFRSKRG